MKAKNLVFVFLVLMSCSPKESIEPAFLPLSDTEQSFHFQYQRSDEVLSPTMELEQISPIGHVLRNLANAIADILLEEENELVPIAPMTFYLPELGTIDFDLLKNIVLKRVFIRLKDQSGPSEGSLGFVKKAEVFLLPGHETNPADRDFIDQSFENEPSDYYDAYRLDEDIILGNTIHPEAQQVLSFERGVNKFACAGRCLDMEIMPFDFKNLLVSGYTSYTIYFRLVIDAIPRDKLELESLFDIQVDADFFR